MTDVQNFGETEKWRFICVESALRHKYPAANFRRLGSGKESVVLTDERSIFKVFDNPTFNYSPLLEDLKDRFRGAKRFVPISDIIKIQGISVLMYDYVESLPYIGGRESEIIEFLLECKRYGVTCWDVKPQNYRIFEDGLKFIDYGWDVKPYNFKDFVFMAQRAYLTLKYPVAKNFKEIARKALTDWEIEELGGFPEFFNRVYRRFLSTDFTCTSPLIYDEETEVKTKYDSLVASSTTLCTNADRISLLIKACYQDGASLYRLVRHIVSQCEQPRIFLEKIVVVDPKTDGFLRQYAGSSIEKTYSTLEELKSEGYIDDYITAPNDEETVRMINKRWFDVGCTETHNIENIPVTPQLFGFEMANGDYVLQADSDVLVARRDRGHDYLWDMMSALRNNPRALSVSFNIAHDPNAKFKEYVSPGNGEYKPEVRFCIFDKKRLMNERPYPNELCDGKLKLSWYKSVQQYQKDHGFVSLRGGDPRTFYIHPPNTYKTDMHAWFSIIDKVEVGDIPQMQYENVDLVGTYADWHSSNCTTSGSQKRGNKTKWRL